MKDSLVLGVPYCTNSCLLASHWTNFSHIMTHLIWSGNLNVPVCIKLWEVCRYQLTTEAEEKCNPWSRSSSMIFRPALSCTSTTRVHIGDNLTVGGPVPHDLTGFGDTSPRRPSGDDSKHPRPSLRPALRPRCPYKQEDTVKNPLQLLMVDCSPSSASSMGVKKALEFWVPAVA